MDITLQPNEVAAVLEALNYYLPQLREEIGRTEDYDLREGLKAQAAILTTIVERLGGTLTNPDMPQLGADNPPWG